jgi:hypothetical protein
MQMRGKSVTQIPCFILMSLAELMLATRLLVADYIDIWSIGNSVIVFGDTNSRYTRALDGITVFGTQNPLTDVYVELENGGVNPTVEVLCDNPSLVNNC